METGYFARPSQNGQSGKWTKVHVLDDSRKPLCHYKPHETMQFVWNSHGVHVPYIECETCKKKYKTHFEIRSYEKFGKIYYYAEFYRTAFGLTIYDIVKTVEREFSTEEEARRNGIRCRKLYTKFLNEVNSKTQ